MKDEKSDLPKYNWSIANKKDGVLTKKSGRLVKFLKLMAWQNLSHIHMRTFHSREMFPYFSFTAFAV